MPNTYGIRSVNRETFNQKYHEHLRFPRAARNVVVTALRVNNAVLNVSGYIPGVSLVSGCVRAVIGTGIIGVTLAIGEREASSGAIIGRWYDEAIGTGMTQIARGALEALVPFGWVVNAALDIAATPFNLAKEVEGSLVCDGCMTGGGRHEPPHDDANYPIPFRLLHLV
ncbi:hypothetical protein [Candidatus Rhabdochlamydia sp. T3358]|uniref:hypothetical protein n=1 Tax=Candidatus Rhabdochlamydia sp. T3358 TaxID=2099795 RepID=UPI0010BC3E1F|nr:hypothetical protein [Candidatus Rhabdochlamydia sp. T3358]VHN99660.1 hypothetical protein RHT_00096 [Candidatus Rhabdochlamydia sp. T3358]